MDVGLSKKKRISHKQIYLMMAPFFILFFVFTILPVVISIGFSFTYFNGLELPRFAGLENYIRLFSQDTVFMTGLKNTLIISLLTGPVSYIACFLFAWFINELTPKIRALFTLIFYAPSISGQVYLIWLIIFSGDIYGYTNSILLRVGWIQEPIQWLTDTRYMLGVVIAVQLWMSLGTGFIAFIAGLKSLDKSLSEAAAIDGIKNRFQELWYVSLPQMKSILLFGAVMQITASFAANNSVVALTGLPSVDYATHTLMSHLTDYGVLRYEISYACTIAVLLFFLMLSVNKLVQRMVKGVGN